MLQEQLHDFNFSVLTGDVQQRSTVLVEEKTEEDDDGDDEESSAIVDERTNAGNFSFSFNVNNLLTNYNGCAY